MNTEFHCAPKYSVLSKNQIKEINLATLEVLETVGVQVLSDEGIQLLMDAGCKTKKNKIVQISKHFRRIM